MFLLFQNKFLLLDKHEIPLDDIQYEYNCIYDKYCKIFHQDNNLLQENLLNHVLDNVERILLDQIKRLLLLLLINLFVYPIDKYRFIRNHYLLIDSLSLIARRKNDDFNCRLLRNLTNCHIHTTLFSSLSIFFSLFISLSPAHS